VNANLTFVHRSGEPMSDPDSDLAPHVDCLQKAEEPTSIRNPHRTVPLSRKISGDSTEGPLQVDISADQIEGFALQLETLHDRYYCTFSRQ
jgi:hypothetical protein